MQESGQLKFINRTESDFLNNSELDFGIFFVDGHTEKQMLPHINYKGKITNSWEDFHGNHIHCMHSSGAVSYQQTALHKLSSPRTNTFKLI